MTKGKWLVIFGVFVFGCGVASYQLNPAQGPFPLLGGALGGGLPAMFGFLLMNGSKWAFRAGFIMTVIILMLALAMALHHWGLVWKGGKDLVTPVIDSLLAVAAGVTLRVLKKDA